MPGDRASVFDIRVLGAGPVGAYCANVLARRGFSVQLVDRATFPRDKLCGGGLTKKSLDIIRRLEPSFDRTRLADPVRTLCVVHPVNGQQTRFAIPEGWVALVRRREFDAWWLERALDSGAQFAHEPGEARFTIAADGPTSEYGRQIRGPFRNDEIAVATECTVPNPHGPYLAIILNPTKNPNDMGYSWSFGRHDFAGVGTGVVRSADRHLGTYRDGVVALARGLYGYDCTDFRNWIIPLFRVRPAVLGNVALVGDALGTADPLLVEGIASGLLSADALLGCFDLDRGFAEYPAALRSHPYFRAMPYFEQLQRAGNSDFELTYRMLTGSQGRTILEYLLTDLRGARRAVRRLQVFHPLLAARMFLRARRDAAAA